MENNAFKLLNPNDLIGKTILIPDNDKQHTPIPLTIINAYKSNKFSLDPKSDVLEFLAVDLEGAKKTSEGRKDLLNLMQFGDSKENARKSILAIPISPEFNGSQTKFLVGKMANFELSGEIEHFKHRYFLNNLYTTGYINSLFHKSSLIHLKGLRFFTAYSSLIKVFSDVCGKEFLSEIYDVLKNRIYKNIKSLEKENLSLLKYSGKILDNYKRGYENFDNDFIEFFGCEYGIDADILEKIVESKQSKTMEELNK